MVQTLQWSKIRPSNPDPKSDQIRTPKVRDSWTTGGNFSISLRECCEPGSSGPRFARRIQTPKVIKSRPQKRSNLGTTAGPPASDQPAGPPLGQRAGEPARPPSAHFAASRSTKHRPSRLASALSKCFPLASGIEVCQTFDLRFLITQGEVRVPSA